MRTRVPAAVLGLLLLVAGVAHGQTDFSALRLKPGDVVYITPASGPEVSGRVTFVSPSAPGVDGVEFKPEPGLKIQRRGDPVWDGALSGALLGLVAGVLLAGSECGVQWSFGKCVASSVTWLGGLGTLIDARRVGRTTIYVGAFRSPSSTAWVAGHALWPGRLLLQFTLWEGAPGSPPGQGASVRRVVFGRSGHAKFN